MLGNSKQKWLSVKHRRLLSNILSLGTMQIVGYILPLLTVPYLVRVLGVEKFGLLAFATALNMYFLMLSDYGFNLTATKQISDARDDKGKYSDIFIEVLGVKLILVVFCFFVLLSVASFVDFFEQYRFIWFLGFGMVLGQALFPVWFFQGMEAMKHIAIINLISKGLFTLIIFVIVNEPKDYWLVPALTSLGYVFSGFYGLVFAINNYDIKLKWPSAKGMKFQISDGWHVFLSRVYVNLYTTTNIVILGAMTNNVMVGYYSIAEKILQAFSGLLSPVTYAFYPYLANLYQNSRKYFYMVFARLNMTLLVLSITFALVVYLYSQEIVWLLSGGFNDNIIEVLSVLCVAMVVAPFGSSFTNALLILGDSKGVSLVVFYTMLLNMIIVFPMIYYFEAVGLAYTWVVGQIFHVIIYSCRYFVVRQRGA
ncbi:flippase [Thalassolituus pacificus]|uniref:Flippase n=1 Tax=Thalassolituus pacificus TaxID=2975440 RepID=A0A9X2WE39_9GAMM|nr:flippase [Thalassolituus pacificus]MCT7358574.1 flippase [Thalassolituus pacificus]